LYFDWHLSNFVDQCTWVCRTLLLCMWCELGPFEGPFGVLLLNLFGDLFENLRFFIIFSCLFIYLCFFIYLSPFLSLSPSLFLLISPSISISPSPSTFIFIFIFAFIFIFIFISIFLSISLSISPSLFPFLSLYSINSSYVHLQQICYK
jgi:hypothetical protein